ncbi:flavin-containing monooxygenase [Mesorhizobium australicum]|uniref:Predicted flavoprotein CzcO associated with the cation diffusion facilitator CzcD n=1 Tax=Mesorhizobium australicum TaxID=536018 RepID=A0A1X7P1I2_9HYPH|nr:NAD(P)/FAD-dependent oxidoreductase [Mesorhizobium australicum]SMH44646.1 Predicted flavoprotein CzcO associated with the cation diffusion facilitator CzcD [Mesorhizobium australicum]
MTDRNRSGNGVSPAKRVDVIVVGAGFGGMYATYKFREMGKNVVSIEAGGDVGGVWYWNRYPGARCDLMSVDYSYGFSPEVEQEWTWSEQFAGQPEILAYANFVADKLDLRKHYLFNTRVVSAVWNEAAKVWRATTDKGEVLEAPYCIMTTGPLSIPKDPDIPGIDKFKGLLLRAQKWPHEPVSFEGKRVGLIGTGSTGIQVVQEVGRKAGELFVFQRTPSFTLPMRNHVIDADYAAEMKRNYRAMREAMRNNPTGGTRPATTRPYFSLPPQQRQQVMEQAWINGGHTFLGSFSDLMTNEEANGQVADFVRDKIGQIVKDPKTAEALKPRGYPIFARRPCLDTDYYETYNLPNVHLVNVKEDPIVEITEKGIRTESGETELDILIFATGYDALTGALLAFDVVGRDGRNLKDKWKSGPRSYLGFMLEGFPNMFAPSGPNGPAALANLITIAEHDVDWIAEMISWMEANGVRTVEPTAEAEDGWMKMVLTMAEKSLIRKANTWWVGANVKGKPQGLTMFIGGFAKYRELCEAAAQNRKANFVFDRPAVTAAA